MTRALLALLMVSGIAWSQAKNACDLDGNGAVEKEDVDRATSMSIGKPVDGKIGCTARVRSGLCDVITVQRVINAATGGTCYVTQVRILEWAGADRTIRYDVFALEGSGERKLNTDPVNGNSFLVEIPEGEKFGRYLVKTVAENPKRVKSKLLRPRPMR